MSKLKNWILACLFVTGIALLMVSPASARFPKLTTTLFGPAIDGVEPEGRAVCDNVKVEMEIRVKDVNLPDGTVLDVIHVHIYHIGTLTLEDGRARGEFVPRANACGRHDALHLLHGDTTILMAEIPWDP
jgi:hypothetical protein